MYNRNLYHLTSNKLRHIINFFNKNLQIIFFFLILYGLSISIFLKEINYIFLSNFDLRILEIYRFLIIIFSLAFFFNMEKKVNFNIVLIILLSFIFIFNSFFGRDLKFDIPHFEFYHMLSYDTESYFFSHKFKTIIINSLNVILPLIVLSLCKNVNFSLKKFQLLSFKICKIFLYLISCLMIYKILYNKFGYFFFDYSLHLDENNNLLFLNKDNENIALNPYVTFVNVHSLLLILNMYFILLIDRLFNKIDVINLKNIFNIFLVFFCFFVSNTSIHFLICSISFFLYLFYFRKSIKYYLVLIFLIFLIFLLFQNIFHSLFFINLFDPNLNELTTSIKFTEPGSFLFSIYIRIMHAKYFLFHSSNLNFLIGNNIFVQNIYTYPHNLLVDIFICSGFMGISLILFIFVRLFFLLKNKININNFFFLNILIQSFIFSNLSGFFFTNIIFNIVLAACFCFFKEKDSTINLNS